MIDKQLEGPVLVTGGAGYIGGQTVLCLLDLGVDVVVIDDFSTGEYRPYLDRTHFYEARVHDRPFMETVLKRHDVKSVLHFAGSIQVAESIENPLKYYENNTDGSRLLLAAAVNANVKRFIFSSTAAVYGTVKNSEPVAESVDAAPLNPYGWSKFFTERTLRDVAAAHPLQYGILRYFNVAGADTELRHGQFLDNPVHLIGRSIDAMCGRAGPLQVYGNSLPTPDGTGVRDYIHVCDLALAHLAVLAELEKTDNNFLLNLGYGRGHSVLDVVRCIEKHSGEKVPFEFAEARAGEAPSVVADITRLGNTLDWQPEHADLDDIVRSALAWTAKQHAN